MRPILTLLLAFLLPTAVHAGTKVRISTTIGEMVLELYDEDKPVTVANFLRYIRSGRYEDTFLHRLIPGFIVQGGGYSLTEDEGALGLDDVKKFDPIVNEYAVGKTYPNVFGTIAMAKVPAEDGQGNPIPGGGPDSATSEWFLNLANNSSNLDNQNGGFTVFGRIVAGEDVLTKFNTFFNKGNSGGPGVYSVDPFPNLPLLAGVLNVSNFIHARFSILSDAKLTLSGKSKIVTKSKSAKISGLLEGDVAKVEWRLGKKGKWRSKSAAAKWKIRVAGLERGSNLVFVRGVSADGNPVTPIRKIRVVRK